MKFQSINFTCESCGAPLKYSPVTASLKCEFCGTTQPIEQSNEIIYEYNFQEALVHLDRQEPQAIDKEITCNKCAAHFTLTPYSVSSNCPYCGTPAITDFVQEITPKSLLPFTFTQEQAKQRFKAWIGSLWFAPNQLKEYIDGEEKLQGYYLPHWIYDTDTVTHYRGQRGDIYYVTVERTVVVNGQPQRIMQQEPRIHWTPVSGTVQNSFDDVTVGASRTIPHTILDSLGSWDTTRLIPFNEKYLSGFESEEYTIGLDNGFEYAKVKMDYIIRQSIRAQIGGDQQQINNKETQYHNTTYKNALFPIWIAQFKYKGKVYNYAINAQSGKIVGERPYSIMKIVLLVGFILVVILGAVYLDEHPEVLEGVIDTPSSHSYQYVR
ncbi:MAG: primosomal protein N' (replication factor Y) - superfamily II helicase [Campylobacterales bacterium]|nr:primosomal protein N' (replication factor Y) - superfamily II helicase [Campylobacterales bacterium]